MIRPALLLLVTGTIALLVYLAVLPATARQAEPHSAINDSGAARLEALFSDLLSRYDQAAKVRGGALVAEGHVLVEQGDNYYAVTLPRLAYTTSAGSRAEIGMIAINARPGATAAQWKMTAAVPSPIVLYEPQGHEVITIKMGRQNFSGIWHEQFGNFIKLNALYSDLMIDNIADEVRLEIPALSAVYDLTQDQNGRWSGPTGFVLSGLRMLFANDGTAAQIDKIAINTTISGYDTDETPPYGEKITALAESARNAETASNNQAHSLYNLVFGFLGNAWDGVGFELALEGFSMATPDSAQGKAGATRFAEAGLALNMAGLRSEDVTLGLKLHYSGLARQSAEQSSSAALPDHLRLDLELTRLPYGALVGMGAGAAHTGAQSQPLGTLMGQQALTLAPQFMADARTQIKLEQRMGTKDYTVTSSALLNADAEAAKAYSGQGTINVTGYEKLLAALKTDMAKPGHDPAHQQKIATTLNVLTLMQMMGQQSKDGQGRTVRSYNLVLEKDGTLTLNGTDLSALLPGAGN